MVVMLFPGDNVFLGSLWKAYLKMPGKFFFNDLIVNRQN